MRVHERERGRLHYLVFVLVMLVLLCASIALMGCQTFGDAGFTVEQAEAEVDELASEHAYLLEQRALAEAEGNERAVEALDYAIKLNEFQSNAARAYIGEVEGEGDFLDLVLFGGGAVAGALGRPGLAAILTVIGRRRRRNTPAPSESHLTGSDL